MTERHRMDGRRAIAFAVGASASGVLPGWLVGVFVVQVRLDLDIGLSLYGALIAGFFVSTAGAAALIGPTVDRIGARRSIQVGAALTTVAMFGTAGSTAWWQLATCLVVAGAGQGFVHPAANRLLSRVVRRRLGLAFGIKQSSIPIATMVAGTSLPTLGALVGWRGTFVVFGVLVLLLIIAAERVGWGPSLPPSRALGREERRSVQRRLIDLAIGGALGSAAASPLSAFLVESGVDAGFTESVAASVLALSGAAGFTARIAVGYIADFAPRVNIYVGIAVMLALGSTGYAALALGSMPLFVAGTVIGHVFGWGWNGLLHYRVVQDFPTSPAVATSTLQPGLALGAGAGPFIYGLLVQRWSYDVGWLAMAAFALAASMVLAWHGLRGRGSDHAKVTE